jgi:hypothetical protein
MATGTRIGPDGRPIDEGFFGLGNALASLPGTPILGGGRMPVGPGGEGLTPGQPPPGTAPPEAPGGGINGYRSDTGYGSPLAGSTPQTNPGLPPPASTAGTGGFWGGQSPFQQGVTGTQNNQTVPFASERYVTPEAANKLGQTFGANVVEQNLTNTASPGSSAPSAPMLGLDFNRGDIQDASMGAYQLQRGDSPELVAQRYAAGLNNTGWGGPAPAVSRGDENGMWNYSTPISTNTPTAAQSGFFAPQPDAGAGVYAANKAGQGNYGLSSGSGADQAQLIAWLRSQLGQ